MASSNGFETGAQSAARDGLSLATAGALDAVPLTPSDTATQLPAGYACFRGLRVTSDGIVVMTTVLGAVRTFAAGYFPMGVDHARAFVRLNAGTTATVEGLV